MSLIYMYIFSETYLQISFFFKCPNVINKSDMYARADLARQY